MKIKKHYKIMMVGVSPGYSGGVSALIQTYMDSFIMKKLDIDYYQTYLGSTYLSNANFKKIVYYIKGIIRIFLNIHHYAVIHIHSSPEWSFRRILPVIFVGKLMKKKVILHLHGDIIEFDDYYRKALYFEKYIIEYGFNCANKIIVLSAKFIRKTEYIHDLSKIVIVPNFIINQRIKDCQLTKKNSIPKIILFLGAIKKTKGIYDLINALDLIKTSFPKIRLLLCGIGDNADAQNYIKNLDLGDYVDLMGWVGGNRKEALLEEAYIYALPSYTEGVPISILEAMAKGTPIITTRVGGTTDFITNNLEGFLIEPGNVAELANRIKSLLNDDELWSRMGKAAIEKVRSHFNTVCVYNRLKYLYEELMK